ncbi:Pyoverdine/dityrosine biosynthesis protein-domain-containing protein [Podospora australis]|uniref:Pyoverdine/dityrosine biosynthesis protein-domain-containing protein n=1 Tax=Podospora australis TaxID=1536484 RepID=A0AAN6WS98_9PEZI|nr:Pyoverdine/dityrosine biosynthesis protein-domain-containing protein [Podospora australis]
MSTTTETLAMPALMFSSSAKVPSIPGSPMSFNGGLDEADVKMTSDILNIISKYRLEKHGSGPASGHDTLKFFAVVYDQVKTNESIKMCLPAFPFKSPNHTTKVTGRLPDMTEQFALAHLNGLCAAIGDIYKPGAELTIISDGLVYNDLLGVPDKDVWAYGQTLRNLAVEKGFSKNIKFSRLQDLLHVFPSDDLDEISYVANATEFRRALLNSFGRPDYDPSFEISKNEDTCLTYRGYIKFLESDLKHVYPIGPERSKSKFKKGIEYVAKRMLMRGDAFARAVRERFPTHLRLSIHQTSSYHKGKTVTKLPTSLLPTNSSWTTPWHCCIGLKADGTILSLPRDQFDADPTFELIHDEKGNPSYFREKSPLFSFGENSSKVWIEPMYPTGLLIRPFASTSLHIKDIPIRQIRTLVERNAPVCLRDFKQATNRELFIQKAEEMGKILGWPGRYETILSVKDIGTQSGEYRAGSALSAENMPFHYDGIFKTTQDPVTGKIHSVPPRFQMFTAVTPGDPGTGFTLFAASRLLFRYMPQDKLTLEDLRKMTMEVNTTSFAGVALTGLPIVVDHPTTGLPCLRYHEHWPQSKTKFDPMDTTIDPVGIEGHTDESVRGILDDLLYDRRVCYRHAWKKGDIVISDDFAMMHTRTEFVSGGDRELWRIHLD